MNVPDTRYIGHLDEATQRVLELALREAFTLGHRYISPEHILLAILRADGSAAALLHAHDVDIHQLRMDFAKTADAKRMR